MEKRKMRLKVSKRKKRRRLKTGDKIIAHMKFL